MRCGRVAVAPTISAGAGPGPQPPSAPRLPAGAEPVVGDLRDGRYVLPTHRAGVNRIDLRDVGEVVARAMTDPGFPAGTHGGLQIELLRGAMLIGLGLGLLAVRSTQEQPESAAPNPPPSGNAPTAAGSTPPRRRPGLPEREAGPVVRSGSEALAERLLNPRAAVPEDVLQGAVGALAEDLHPVEAVDHDRRVTGDRALGRGSCVQVVPFQKTCCRVLPAPRDTT